MRAKKPTVFFDRDGTLIEDKVYLNDPENIVYLPGVFLALHRLFHAGFQLVIVSNQSGVAKGLVTLPNLQEIHNRIRGEFSKHGVSFANIYFSVHASGSDHPSRKPNPGMLLDADLDFGVDFSRSWMVGDRMLDVEAGHRAKCRSILLGKKENPTDFKDWSPPEFIAGDLEKAAQFILSFK